MKPTPGTGRRPGEGDNEARRALRKPLDPRKPVGWFIEPERAADGRVVPVLTVFLTNRECPWRCVFCDLWTATLESSVGVGDLPAQLDGVLADPTTTVAAPRQVKLYNAGSFFDPRAVPIQDYGELARRVAGFERVIVECHPSLAGPRVREFQRFLHEHAGEGAAGPVLEVAMGLETINPEVYPRLNKRMTPQDFRDAAVRLRSDNIAVRAFVLVGPPFQPRDTSVAWAMRSAAFAFDCGATAASLIPVRPGNPELDALEKRGEFSPPELVDLEDALDGAMRPGAGRVFADLWELQRFTKCGVCAPARLQRLARMNLTQEIEPRVACASCGGRG